MKTCVVYSLMLLITAASISTSPSDREPACHSPARAPRITAILAMDGTRMVRFFDGLEPNPLYSPSDILARQSERMRCLRPH